MLDFIMWNVNEIVLKKEKSLIILNLVSLSDVDSLDYVSIWINKRSNTKQLNKI